jgi:hypothetical protein
MGAGTSAPTTHEGALKATGNVRRFCDEIMKYMLNRLNISDFYRLASRTECSKYVIFLANKLDTTFRGLSFAPARGSAGKLYFQPIDKLKAPSAKEKAERESLCLFLAYFYIRIFQIYGAIALTLLDDANVVSKAARDQGFDMKAIQFDREIDFYGPPGAPNPLPQSGWKSLFESPTDKTFGPITTPRSINTRRSSRQSTESPNAYANGMYHIRGGAAPVAEEELGKFKLFKGLVTDKRVEKLQIVPRSEKTEDGGYLFQIPNLKGSFHLNPRGGFTDSKAGETNATLFFETPSGHNAKTNFYGVEVSIITGAGRRESGNYLKVREVQYKALVEELNRKLAYKGQRYSTDKMRDLDENELDRIFEPVYGVRNSEFRFEEVNGDYKIFVKSRTEGIAIDKFLVTLKNIIDQSLGLRRKNTDGTRRNERNAVGQVSLEDAIKTVFDYKPINALRVDRPIALCSARALQLLGNHMGDQFTPAICSQQFLYQEKDGKMVPRETAVPDMDKSLMDSDGIRLLTQLFYDDSRFRQYKITKSPIAMNDYMEFLIKMTKLFQGANDNPLITKFKDIIAEQKPAVKKAQGEVYSANQIVDEEMKDTCNIYGKQGKPIEIKSAKGTAVLQKAAQLFGAQVAHAARCGKILKELFTIVTVSGTQSIVINKNIFIKGISEVNRINQLTRRTLVAYYENCEKLYREGVATLMKEEKPKEQEQQNQQEDQQNQQQQGQ